MMIAATRGSDAKPSAECSCSARLRAKQPMCHRILLHKRSGRLPCMPQVAALKAAGFKGADQGAASCHAGKDGAANVTPAGACTHTAVPYICFLNWGHHAYSGIAYAGSTQMQSVTCIQQLGTQHFQAGKHHCLLLESCEPADPDDGSGCCRLIRQGRRRRQEAGLRPGWAGQRQGDAVREAARPLRLRAPVCGCVSTL